MVLGGMESLQVPIPHQIARLPTWKVITRSSAKIWKAQNVKRRRINETRTVPHGYNAWAEEAVEDQDLLEVLDGLMDV